MAARLVKRGRWRKPLSPVINFLGVSSGMDGSVTKLLQDWCEGDDSAFVEVAAIVNRELRRLAASYMRRERPGHTLQPTALVNEAWVRLMGQRERADWRNRSHFMAIAAQHM